MFQYRDVARGVCELASRILVGFFPPVEIIGSVLPSKSLVQSSSTTADCCDYQIIMTHSETSPRPQGPIVSLDSGDQDTEEEMTKIMDDFKKGTTNSPRGFHFQDRNEVKMKIKDGIYIVHKHYKVSSSHPDLVVVVAQDNNTGADHIVKRIPLEDFNIYEVKASMELNKRGNHAPYLKLVQLKDDKVHLHMERIPGPTLKEAIQNLRKSKAEETDARFMLAIMLTKEILDVIIELHDIGYVHNDLHGRNVMLLVENPSSLLVKVIDFGAAAPIDENNKYIDILQILKITCFMFGIPTEDLSGPDRLQHNWRAKLDQWTSDIDEKWKTYLLDIFEKGNSSRFRSHEDIQHMLKTMLKSEPELTELAKKLAVDIVTMPGQSQTALVEEEFKGASGDAGEMQEISERLALMANEQDDPQGVTEEANTSALDNVTMDESLSTVVTEENPEVSGEFAGRTLSHP